MQRVGASDAPRGRRVLGVRTVAHGEIQPLVGRRSRATHGEQDRVYEASATSAGILPACCARSTSSAAGSSSSSGGCTSSTKRVVVGVRGLAGQPGCQASECRALLHARPAVRNGALGSRPDAQSRLRGIPGLRRRKPHRNVRGRAASDALRADGDVEAVADVKRWRPAEAVPAPQLPALSAVVTAPKQPEVAAAHGARVASVVVCPLGRGGDHDGWRHNLERRRPGVHGLCRARRHDLRGLRAVASRASPKRRRVRGQRRVAEREDGERAVAVPRRRSHSRSHGALVRRAQRRERRACAALPGARAKGRFADGAGHCLNGRWRGTTECEPLGVHVRAGCLHGSPRLRAERRCLPPRGERPEGAVDLAADRRLHLPRPRRVVRRRGPQHVRRLASRDDARVCSTRGQDVGDRRVRGHLVLAEGGRGGEALVAARARERRPRAGLGGPRVPLAALDEGADAEVRLRLEHEGLQAGLDVARPDVAHARRQADLGGGRCRPLGHHRDEHVGHAAADADPARRVDRGGGAGGLVAVVVLVVRLVQLRATLRVQQHRLGVVQRTHHAAAVVRLAALPKLVRVVQQRHALELLLHLLRGRRPRQLQRLVGVHGGGHQAGHWQRRRPAAQGRCTGNPGETVTGLPG
mmetsp:Transcript_16038/g.56014  ORF Transcript_16038/g.56014 Transcript_16038/m.56014 type:complete len:639 (+) Transcript_16038:4750-6666(+)